MILDWLGAAFDKSWHGGSEKTTRVCRGPATFPTSRPEHGKGDATLLNWGMTGEEISRMTTMMRRLTLGIWCFKVRLSLPITSSEALLTYLLQQSSCRQCLL